MPDSVAIVLRWIHIASMATLLGGIIFWRLVLVRAGEDRGPAEERIARAFRPWVFLSVAGLLFSGSINYLATPGHTRFYHMLFGIKLLLAAHVIAVAILIVRPDNPRRTRMVTGVMISGLAILAISAWLRRIF